MRLILSIFLCIAIAAGIAWLGGRKEAEDVQDDDADEIEEEEATA